MQHISNHESSTEGVSRLLNRIIEEERLEAEWLDLLSQLEYVGCRKIVKAVGFEAVRLSTLRHISEESSHAFLLKREAERAGLEDRSWTEGLFADLGWNYFRRLDERVSQLVKIPEAYPAVSWAVETRVLKIYPDYLEKSRRLSVKKVLGAILAQERAHGATFDSYPLQEEVRSQALLIEAQLWAELVDGLWHRCQTLSH